MFDLLLLFILFLTVLVGLFRGCIKELFSAVCMIIALMMTYHNGAFFLELTNVSPGPFVTPFSCLGVFIVSFITLSLINTWVMYLLLPIRLGPVDRILGLLCGLVRGVLYCYFVFAVLSICYYALGGDIENDLSLEEGYYLPGWVTEARSYWVMRRIDRSISAIIPDEVLAAFKGYANFFGPSPELKVEDTKKDLFSEIAALQGDVEGDTNLEEASIMEEEGTEDKTSGNKKATGESDIGLLEENF